jgi:hypothetical protein
MMTRSGLGLVLALTVAASWMLAGLAVAAEPFTVLLIAPAGGDAKQSCPRRNRTVRQFVMILFVLGGILPAQSADTQPSPNNDILGFDASKVCPADPKKGEPVARLFYDYIYRSDIEAAAQKLSDDEARRLTGKIFGDLRQRCMDRHKIIATPDEIQQFVDAMRRLSPTNDDASEARKKDDRRGYEAIGEQLVKGWKLDRMLYKEYGGTVIFQQGNPFEPVGAYRGFLEEMEKAKVFEIYDPDNRQKFWHYFVRQHPFQVPAKNINFDNPWWMQKR